MARRPSNNIISAKYGWRIHPITGKREFHAGEDISASGSLTLVMPIDGTIKSYAMTSGYGRLVTIVKGDTLIRLGHTERLIEGIHVGARYNEGTHIAIMGSTGLSTGPHVHWEVRVDGKLVDPEQWLKAQLATAALKPIKIKEIDRTMATNYVDTSTYKDGRASVGTVCATGGDGGSNWFEYKRTLKPGELATELYKRHGTHIPLNHTEFVRIRGEYQKQATLIGSLISVLTSKE